MVFAYGPHSIRVLHGAITGGMPEIRARAFDDQKKMAQVLKQLAKPGDVLLFKGSHGMHMEKVLEMFLQEEK
jgi:UDP-N-acetylmuramyl pentapeptide synthase